MFVNPKIKFTFGKKLNQPKKMKKVFTLIAVAGVISFSACGPSAEEQAAKAQATADSIAAVKLAEEIEIAAKAQAIADSTMAAAAQAAAEKAATESAAASTKATKSVKKSAPKPKTNQEQIKENKKELNKDRG